MRYILIILVSAAIALGLTYIGTSAGWYSWSKIYPVNLAFMVFLILVSDYINQRALEQQGRAVIIPYLLSTVLKLLFSGIFLALLIYRNIDLAREIVFSFLPYYAFFSAVEIVIVNMRLKAKKS